MALSIYLIYPPPTCILLERNFLASLGAGACENCMTDFPLGSSVVFDFFRGVFLDPYSPSLFLWAQEHLERLLARRFSGWFMFVRSHGRFFSCEACAFFCLHCALDAFFIVYIPVF